jgi:hypothetical protein
MHPTDAPRDEDPNPSPMSAYHCCCDSGATVTTLADDVRQVTSRTFRILVLLLAHHLDLLL